MLRGEHAEVEAARAAASRACASNSALGRGERCQREGRGISGVGRFHRGRAQGRARQPGGGGRRARPRRQRPGGRGRLLVAALAVALSPSRSACSAALIMASGPPRLRLHGSPRRRLRPGRHHASKPRTPAPAEEGGWRRRGRPTRRDAPSRHRHRHRGRAGLPATEPYRRGFTSGPPTQNVTLNPNCACRGSRVPLACPKLPDGV